MKERAGADENRMELEQSPIHRAVWERSVPDELFTAEAAPMSPAVRELLDRSLEVVRRRRRAGILYDDRGFVSDETIGELSRAGYWRLRVEPAYGGAGGSFVMLTQAITEMMLADPWVGGLASTQAGLGPVTLLQDVGTPAQKERLLPPLARGDRLGAFAVTEPRTSSDWNRMITTARRDGDKLLVTGEKLFISNGAPGRTVALLCRLDGRLEMLVVELPPVEDERFQIVEYGLRAPAHIRNVGLRFRDLPVPADNLLVPRTGDGRTIGYRALNYGRVAVCAFAAGMLRRIAGTLLPWVQQRITFGLPIGTRGLVQRRLGQLAARIVACDALGLWAAALLDDGYRGELECVTTKVFASEALKDATVDILLKTHGGRALLEGNMLADNVHDLLAPTVYEGENELLTLGFVAKLERAHGARYLSPIAEAMRSAGDAAAAKPRQLWAARRPLASYVAWVAERQARQLGFRSPRVIPTDGGELEALAHHVLHGAAIEISERARKPEAAERQALIFDLGRRVQQATVILVASRYAARQADPLVRTAGLCMAMELGQELFGLRPSPGYYRLLDELGAEVIADHFAPVAAAERPPIAMADELATRGPIRSTPPAPPAAAWDPTDGRFMGPAWDPTVGSRTDPTAGGLRKG